MKADFLLAGVGGQGVVLTGDILAEVGLRLRLDVKKADVHGLAQRGGAVEACVRWGKLVNSPLIAAADFLLGLESLEAARCAARLRQGGVALVNRHRLLPPGLSPADYPNDEEVARRFAGKNLHWVDATAAAASLGNPILAGTVLLGHLSRFLPAEEAVWLSVLNEKVPPRHRETNLLAFRRGRDPAPGERDADKGTCANGQPGGPAPP